MIFITSLQISFLYHWVIIEKMLKDNNINNIQDNDYSFYKYATISDKLFDNEFGGPENRFNLIGYKVQDMFLTTIANNKLIEHPEFLDSILDNIENFLIKINQVISSINNKVELNELKKCFIETKDEMKNISKNFKRRKL